MPRYAVGVGTLVLVAAGAAAAPPDRPPRPAHGTAVALAVVFPAERAGDVLTLALEVETRKPLGEVEARVSFNPAVVTLLAVEPGSAIGFGPEVEAVTAPGEVTVTARNDAFEREPTGRFEVARLAFLVSGLPGDFTPIEIDDVALLTTRGRPFAPEAIDDTAVLVAAPPPPLRLDPAPDRYLGEPVFAGGAGKAAFQEAKKALEAEKKKWQPEIDAIKKKHEEFKAAKGDRARQRQLWQEACELARQLEQKVQEFVRRELPKILATDSSLAALVQKLQEYEVRFWPPVTGATLGRTNHRDKTIELNLDILDDAVKFFSTCFHECVHATEGTTHASDDLGFYAEELWTEDQENRFLDHIGEPQTAGTTSDEWNYTLRWKEANGELKKKVPGPGYEPTAAGKAKADCYLKHLADNGWKWEGDPPPGGAAVIYYNQIRWKLDARKDTTAKGKEFPVIEATDTKSIGEEYFAETDPCK